MAEDGKMQMHFHDSFQKNRMVYTVRSLCVEELGNTERKRADLAEENAKIGTYLPSSPKTQGEK